MQTENNYYYTIARSDGGDIPPEALFFVFRLDFNPHARQAVLTYAENIREKDAEMADSIREYILKIAENEQEFLLKKAN